MLGVGESWSPKRTPEISESVLRGQNSMAGCALYINEKVLKCRCPKWARIAHFGHLKHKLWPKEGPRVELPGFRQF
jgi:hypothetical protein